MHIMNEEVSAYIETATDDRKALYEKLQTQIIELFPDARIVMSSQIPTYRMKSGWVALGYIEKGVALYTNGPQHILEFKKSHPAIKAKKNSIEFSLTDDIPIPDVQKVISHAMEEPAQVRGPKRR
jgi:uncharacterized protein YdhG (YjbR/CyaY superfamily)